MFLSKGLYSKPDGKEMSLKSANEHAYLSRATHCIHVPVRNTKPFTPKVHKHICTHRHTDTLSRGFGSCRLRTNLSLGIKEGLGRPDGVGDGGCRLVGNGWLGEV